MAAENALRLTAGEARVSIRPFCGGTVDELLLQPRGSGPPVAVLAGQQNTQRFTPCDPGIFRGRLLLPFSDRIPGGQYRYRGGHYQLEINDRESGDAIHGFLYRTPLEVRHRGESDLHLGGRIEGVEGYPFTLEISLFYLLEPGRFSLSLSARNVGSADAPVTLGWHPYFTLPGAARVDDLVLRLPASRFVEVDETLIPTGELPPVGKEGVDFREGRSVGVGELDVGFEMEGNQVSLTDGERRLLLSLGPTTRYVQLFTPPDRESIAVEPLTAATNAFNRPELGLQLISPEEELTLECSLLLE